MSSHSLNVTSHFVTPGNKIGTTKRGIGPAYASKV
jgi:adenylosuccinate synthase